jgi:small-conductance mechanosensitive channel
VRLTRKPCPAGLITLLSIMVLLAPGTTRSQPAATAPATPVSQDTLPAGAPVVVEGDTLFRLYGTLGAFTPAERAAAVAGRISRLAARYVSHADSIVVVEEENRSELVVGEQVLMTVLDDDAAPLNRPRPVVARLYATQISAAIAATVERTSLRTIAIGMAYSAIAIFILLLVLWGMRRTFPRITTTLDGWRATRIPAFRIQQFELLSADRLADTLIGLVRVTRVIVTVILLYVFVTAVLGFFPYTAPLADRIASYVLDPLSRAWTAFIDYLPNIFFIAVIGLLTRYVLKFVHLFFSAIETGTVEFEGFDREWAQPTYKIVRFLILAFVVVVIFPYLPGAGSDAFKGVSLFLGALFTLGSSSAISNIVAGTLLTYTRAFQVGDRVVIGETTGDVIERSLLVTRLRTIKQVDVTIPNAMVLSGHITNYTSMAVRGGIALHTTITIGYDAPWRDVHAALIKAAKSTEGVLEDPAPFVFQTSLDDFYVSYQINAYVNQAHRMAAIYSDLHANIQDSFNEAGIEILSPHYRAQRDGNMVTIPANYLSPDYQAPRFRVETAGEKS